MLVKASVFELYTTFTRFALVLDFHRMRENEINSLYQEYGPVVRIAPNHVSIAEKTALPIIYGHGVTAYDKSDFYKEFIANSPSVFSAIDRRTHARKRRIVSQAFSADALRKFAPFVSKALEALVWKLNDISATKAEIDIVSWLNYLTFDVLSDLAFGEAIGMIANGNDVVSVCRSDGIIDRENAVELVDGREHLAAVLGIDSTFSWISKWIPDPFLFRGRQSSSGLADFARRNVMQRLQSGNSRGDILDRILQAQMREFGSMSLTKDQLTEVIAETITLLSAGSDTTATSVTALIFLVLSDHEIHSKLRAELDQRIGVGNLPTYDEVKDLPYLQAVIDER
ncbi:hypothetical protein VKT23_000025 [Stygiomarasmius scandens]|uniref:Cytochrome P450 n=1 Tax=Marasmiellus scandens TaxID=2682957 RepID=A0ABR1K3C2_9AGAR